MEWIWLKYINGTARNATNNGYNEHNGVMTINNNNHTIITTIKKQEIGGQTNKQREFITQKWH